MHILTGSGDAREFRVGIVLSTYHDFVTSRLRDGAVEALRNAGIDTETVVVVVVPGAFEIPQAACRLAANRHPDDDLRNRLPDVAR